MTADVTLQPGERLEPLGRAGLRIIQRTDAFRFGMDSVLLADFARVSPGDRVADFGAGNGILPLLLIGRGKGQRFDAIELQPAMAELARRNIALNGLEDRVRVHCMDVRSAPEALGAPDVDHVICNPPYGQPGTTLHNPAEALQLARHQDADGLAGWFRAAQQVLRGRGRLSLIYPAPRMLEVMKELEAARLAPKRFRLVYPAADRAANLVLIEAVRDARPMLHPEPPLIIRHADGTPTDELRRIYGEDGEESPCTP